jgi:ATP-dependent Clp protease protease subunit
MGKSEKNPDLKEEKEFKLTEEKENELGEEILKVLGFGNNSEQSFLADFIKSNRKVYFFGDVDKASVLSAICQINFFEKIGPGEDIEIVINSGGGSVTDCFALIDAMNISNCDFRILVLGQAASAACLIASNGTKGKRRSGKNAEFMFHEIISDIPPARTSEVVHYKDGIVRIQKRFSEVFSKNVGRSEKEIKDMFYRDKEKFMTASEARKFGIIDRVCRGKRKDKT